MILLINVDVTRTLRTRGYGTGVSEYVDVEGRSKEHVFLFQDCPRVNAEGTSGVFSTVTSQWKMRSRKCEIPKLGIQPAFYGSH